MNQLVQGATRDLYIEKIDVLIIYLLVGMKLCKIHKLLPDLYPYNSSSI